MTQLRQILHGGPMPWTGRARPPAPRADNAAAAGYLYVRCARSRHHGYPAQARRRAQEVPIVRKTAKWIYYTSETWDRTQAVVGPGRISRQEFETDTRCHESCLADHRGLWCAQHGYPAGVIPVPGDRPGPAARLFFATREAAEAGLYRGERKRAGRAARPTPPIKELRRAMADAHPDRGGTADQFIEARRRYQTVLRAARR